MREAAASALSGAAKLTFVKLLGDRYEVEAMIGGHEREVTLTAAGQVVAGDDEDDEDDDDEHEHP